MSTAALFCVGWTLAVYFASKAVYRRFRRIWLSPVLVTSLSTLALLWCAHIPYAVYAQDDRWLTWLAGPATIAFAVPIYEYRAVVRRHWLSLGLGIGVGMSVALISAVFLAHALHLDAGVSRSLMARSISTPFAVAVASQTGGSPGLVAVFTVVTGLIGMLAGDLVLALLKLRSPIAQGASLGVAAHGFGTAHARERNTEEGVVASLTMILSGMLMVLTGPALIPWASALFLR